MRPNDYLVIPHKNIIKCVQIQENTFECSSTTWSWGINEIITIEREHIPEEINKYIRTPRILITVDNESTFYNFFIAEASVNKNSFDIPLDLNNANRKATITIPSDISSSEKERLKKLLELYL